MKRHWNLSVGLLGFIWPFVTLAAAADNAVSLSRSSRTVVPSQDIAAVYRLQKPAKQVSSQVERLVLRFWTEPGTGETNQWLLLEAAIANGRAFRVWVSCQSDPSEALGQTESGVRRYILQEGAKEPVEYRDLRSGAAVLPVLGAWRYLLPRALEGGGEERGFARRVGLLGHQYELERVERVSAAPTAPSARLMRLRSDVLLGVPQNTRQQESGRRYDSSEYPLVRLTRDDYEVMIKAGMNCFNADAEQRGWLEEQPVYYWGGGLNDLPYPECLYRSCYLGPALFLDEPAVVTRDYVIRPRLEKEPGYGHNLTPEIVLEAFRDHFHKAKYDGSPAGLIRALAARPDVDLGDMTFAQANLYTWETMISTGIHQLREGDGPPPWAIVFEPPGHLGTRRTLPEMDMVYGCQIPTGDPAHLAGILCGLLRGAARLSGREWGISIYGAVDRADSPWLLTHAYDLGARLFFFWDTAQLACVPFDECLALAQHLTDHMENWPQRDLARLKNKAQTVILFPPGYNLGHVHMGKGSLWGLGELNLERKNASGIAYRTVMHHLFTEIERCVRLGIEYDLVWDVPGLELGSYAEIVRVRADGSVEVQSQGRREVLAGPRLPARPGGEPPELAVQVDTIPSPGSAQVTARAVVKEKASPVFYTPRRERDGVFRNAVVFWEIFGPREEDYRVLLSDGVKPEVRRNAAGYEVTVVFGLRKPGTYRLRAATVDEAGRSAVIWQEIQVRE
ncbi:MAG: hypothetical protein U1G07_20680 [Verrucomicrobiota bacterium]